MSAFFLPFLKKISKLEFFPTNIFRTCYNRRVMEDFKMSKTQKTKLQKFVLVLGIVVSVAALALLTCAIVFCIKTPANGYHGAFSGVDGDKPLLAYARFCNAIRKALFGGVDTYEPDSAAVSSFILGLACCILGVIWLVFAAVKKKFIHFLYFVASIAVGFVVSFGYFLGTKNEAYHWDWLQYPLAVVVYSFAYILFIAYVAFFVLNLISLIKIKKAPKAEKEEEKEEPAPAVEEKKEEPVKEEKPAEEVKAEEKPAEPVVAEQPKEEKAEKVEEAKPEEKPIEEPKEEKKEEEKPAPKKAPVAKKPAEKKEPAKKAEPKKEPAKKPEEKKEPAKKAEPKPAEKKEPAKKAEAKPAPKADEKSEPAKKAEPKPAAKPAEKKEPAEAKRRAGAPSAYHIAQHPNGGWKVQGAKSEKALKIFPTQAEAIKYAKELAKNAGVPFRVHSRAGKIRKA